MPRQNHGRIILLYTTLHGCEVEYDDQGQGTPLLLMHAFPLNRTMFSPLPGARLITFDAPAGPLSMDLLADVAAALLDHLGLAQAVVGGVSMGGYATFRFAGRHPQRLLGLVLSNTRPAADTDDARRARYEMMEVARRDGAAEIARRMLPRLLGETTRRENAAVVDRVRQMIEAYSPEAIVRMLEALATRPDSTALLAAIAVPTVVIAGEEDVITPPAESAQWAAAIPGADFHVIPRAGHLSCLEAPQRFAQSLEAVLNR
jgi:pimeloyl-ACP methyl ester carboxylesterase